MSYNYEGMAKDFDRMTVKKIVPVSFKSYDEQRKSDNG